MNTPGPGAYSPKSELQNVSNPKVGFAKKAVLDSNIARPLEFSPGPGTYDVAHKKDIKGMKFGSARPKTAHVQKESAPGPGSYDVNLSAIKSKAPGSKIAAPKKNNWMADPKSSLQSPGPGMYNPESSISKCKSPQIKFSQTGRPPLM